MFFIVFFGTILNNSFFVAPAQKPTCRSPLQPTYAISVAPILRPLKHYTLKPPLFLMQGGNGGGLAFIICSPPRASGPLHPPMPMHAGCEAARSVPSGFDRLTHVVTVMGTFPNTSKSHSLKMAMSFISVAA